jgi:hypothetical protein
VRDPRRIKVFMYECISSPSTRKLSQQHMWPKPPNTRGVAPFETVEQTFLSRQAV